MYQTHVIPYYSTRTRTLPIYLQQQMKNEQQDYSSYSAMCFVAGRYIHISQNTATLILPLESETLLRAFKMSKLQLKKFQNPATSEFLPDTKPVCTARTSHECLQFITAMIIWWALVNLLRWIFQ